MSGALSGSWTRAAKSPILETSVDEGPHDSVLAAVKSVGLPTHLSPKMPTAFQFVAARRAASKKSGASLLPQENDETERQFAATPHVRAHSDQSYKVQRVNSVGTDIASVLDSYYDVSADASEEIHDLMLDKSTPPTPVDDEFPESEYERSLILESGPDTLSPDQNRSSFRLSRNNHETQYESPSVNKLTALSDERDMFGFRKSNHFVSITAFETWSKTYLETLSRRRKKWDALLADAGLAPANGLPIHFPPPSTKVKRYIRKGIPPEYRGAAWFFYAGGAQRLRDNPGLYERMTREGLAVSDINTELIERDLHRTFPDNNRFKPDGYTRPPTVPRTRASASQYQEEPIMIQRLRRVLVAFARYIPKAGYCQSLNFIAGMLLLFMFETFTYHPA